MADAGELRTTTATDAVVHPLTRAAERPCARPGCPAPARATLSFVYGSREATLDRLSERADPQRYDLCVAHAGRTDPPRGWTLTDRRPDDERAPVGVPAAAPRDLGGSATVAVLAAALRAVPDRSEPSPALEPDAQVAAQGDAAPIAPGRTSRPDEPTAELPQVRAPRPVPAVRDRASRAERPATDW